MQTRILLAALLCAGLAAAQRPVDLPGFQTAFAAAERAKAAGDFGAMEKALEAALDLGPGDEYAWRSLAWAEARQGKWEESLLHARENLRRHGEQPWPLRQLCDSGFVAGDLAVVAEALATADAKRASSDAFDLADERRHLATLAKPRRYELEWRVPAPADSRPVRMLMPASRHGGQTFDLTAVEGAAASTKVVEGGRDFLDLTFVGGEPVVLRATLTHVPLVLGAARLAAAPAGPLPADLAPLLGPFTNRVRYDPAHPEVVKLAATLRRPSPAATAQAVLDWLRVELRYEAGHDDSIDAILKSRRGVCHHYANFLTTLCRACGTPAFVAHGVRLPDAGAFKDHGGSHGWAEVWLPGLDWVPVEPLDASTLRVFGGSGYLFFDVSGRGVDDDHFRFTSLQGVPVSGRVVED